MRQIANINLPKLILDLAFNNFELIQVDGPAVPASAQETAGDEKHPLALNINLGIQNIFGSDINNL